MSTGLGLKSKYGFSLTPFIQHAVTIDSRSSMDRSLISFPYFLFSGLMGIGRNKGILGFLGGALFCVPFNYRLLSIAKYGIGKGPIPGSPQSVIVASLALGLAGAFADLLVPTPALTMPSKVCGVPMPRFHLDDNVVVPILSGYACTKIFGLLGWTEGIQLAKFLII